MNSKLSVAALLMLASVSVQAGVVVAAKDSPLPALEADKVKRLFLGREPSVDGQTITVVYQKDGAARTAFESKVLGKSASDLSAYWSKLIFTGKASAPLELSGDDAVRSKVAATPGAVGYVNDGAADDSVKVLFKY